MLLPSHLFASGDSSEQVSERVAESDTKQTSENAATFTLFVGDLNSTSVTNQTSALANAIEKITVSCQPLKFEIRQGKSATISCAAKNNGGEDVEVKSQIIGLEETGIYYYFNGNESTEIFSLPANSSKTFDVGMIASSGKGYEVGKAYDYTIRLSCFESIGCY